MTGEKRKRNGNRKKKGVQNHKKTKETGFRGDKRLSQAPGLQSCKLLDEKCRKYGARHDRPNVAARDKLLSNRQLFDLVILCVPKEQHCNLQQHFQRVSLPDEAVVAFETDVVNGNESLSTNANGDVGPEQCELLTKTIGRIPTTRVELWLSIAEPSFRCEVIETVLQYPQHVKLLVVVLNRKLRSNVKVKNNRHLHHETIPVARAMDRGHLDDQYDNLYTDIILFFPMASTFYCRTLTHNNSMSTLVPCPASWLRLRLGWDGLPAKGSFVKRILSSYVLIPNTTNTQNNLLPAFEKCYQLSDDYECCPLIPPDIFDYDYGGTDPSLTEISKQRILYQRELSKSASNRADCRRYVRGALHYHIPETCLKVDARTYHPGGVDFQVLLLSKDMRKITRTVVSVRDLSSETVLLQQCVSVGQTLLSTQRGSSIGNCRNNNGDYGGMYGLGELLISSKTIKEAAIERNNKILKQQLHDLCVTINEVSAVVYHQINRSIHIAEEVANIKKCHAMGGDNGLSATMDVSIDLGNATHLDIHDASQGLTVWTELCPGTADNWYFIMPNILIRKDNVTYKGLAIKLFHGCSVSWDGRLIRHGTTVTNFQGSTNHNANNHVFGSFWAASNRMIQFLANKQKSGKTSK